MRGTGSSTGVADDEYTEREIADNLAVIAWLAAQPWCTGAVGMFGISWGGFSALQAAMRRPPALRAVIPACFSHDRYHLDVHWWGGARMLAETTIWPAEMVGENALPPDPVRFGEGWRDEWLRRLEATPQWPLASLRHQRRDEHWRHGSAVEDWASISCAVLALGGLSDWYRDAVPATVAGLRAAGRAPVRGVIGPWGHCWPHDGAPGPSIDGIGLMLAWWDRFLRGIGNGVDAGPALLSFVVEPDAAEPFPVGRAPATMPGRWWASNAMAPAVGLELQLRADGALAVPGVAAPGAAEPGLAVPSRVTSSPEGSGQADSMTWEGGPATALTAPFTCTGSEPQGGPLDQRPDDSRSLTWTSEPLGAPLLIAGCPFAELTVSVDQPVAQVVVRLEAVAPGGESALLARGLRNLTRRGGFGSSDPSPVPVGELLRVHISLTYTGARVPAGQRLRVAIAGAAFPVAWPPPHPVALTVHVGPDAGRTAVSRLVLPADAGWAPHDADLGVPAFDPGDAVPLPGIADRWEMSRDDSAGTTVVMVESGGGHRFPERDGLTFSCDERYRFSVADDWATAETEGSTAYRVSWPGGPVIAADGRLRVGSTAESYEVEVSVHAAQDGVPVFSRTWTASIPRDLG